MIELQKELNELHSSTHHKRDTEKQLIVSEELLSKSGNREQVLTQVLESTELTTLVDWLNINKLTINLAKTYFMIFCKSRHKETSNNLKLELSGTCIKEVQEIKILRIVIDNDHSWQSHISYIKAKISKSLGVIYRVKFFF